uniref:Laminin subunit beta 4 n=1 Tax=Denticeps clupeoides TaxID=299321 RepID=A0AAY4CI20_9TELE
VICLLLLLLLLLLNNNNHYHYNKKYECGETSCHPELGDLLVGRAAQLTASSTCGLRGPEKYCILGHLEDEQKCFTCDSRNPYNHITNPSSHQIENVITLFERDRKKRWWQSENGVHRVSIQLNLEAVFQFSHLILTFKTFRPAAMLVERSKDFGRTWKVFRFFAEDCQSSFPGVPEWPANSVDDVVCDSRYSGPEPSSEGEVVLKAVDPSFQIRNPYTPEIQDLITLTNLRVNFTRLFTLGDTQLLRRRRNPEDKYYYALYEMIVRGRCFCNGHAHQCMSVEGSRGDAFHVSGMVQSRCVCLHNTVGDNCERCQDFYNDTPWRPAVATDPHICKRCNCHGHSERCHFDMNRFQATGGVSGGVCEDCRNSRAGPQCERCKPHYYKDPSRPIEDPAACISCNCDPVGSLNDGVCDAFTGRCICKANVEGDRCDSCKYGYYGLRQEDPDGCQACGCNPLGSVQTSTPCDPTTGQCLCKEFAMGQYCDQCQSGFWGLGNTVHPCRPCECDIGGAINNVCSRESGQCQCRPNMVGRTCSDPAPGYFLAPLNYYLYEAEDAAPLDSSPPPPLRVRPTPIAPHATLPKCEQYYRQQGYDFKFINGKVVLTRRERRSTQKPVQGQLRLIPLEAGHGLQMIPRERRAGSAISWTGPGFVRAVDGVGLRFKVGNVPVSLDYNLVLHYEHESTDDWAAVIRIVPLGPYEEGLCKYDPLDKELPLPGSSRVAVLEVPVCLDSGRQYLVDVTLRMQPGPDPQHREYILIDAMGLIPRIGSIQNFCSKSDLEDFQQYHCVELGTTVGQAKLPGECEKLIGSMSARIHNGAIPCKCNAKGAYSNSCLKFGGQCNCKPNVIGRCCDSCAPLTFGFGPDGCTKCDCDTQGSVSELCDQRSGQCQCRRDLTGRRCEQCLPGFYGFPQCRPCECNGLADLCHPVTGACLNCRDHTTGPKCDRCINGYYGDPVYREPCRPCSCPDVAGSGRFFAHSCDRNAIDGNLLCVCHHGYAGPSKCAPGYYGDLSLPGSQCEKCHCNNDIDPIEEVCDSVTGVCLNCRHNTEGLYCEKCKPGYYGDALRQGCRECYCDRRGTKATQCPLDSPCFCDQRNAQCPCRVGVEGVSCDQCTDGFWNMDGQLGCQPCSCHPEHSTSIVCDKVTGQCPCKQQFGGKHCDRCGENYFSNPRNPDGLCLFCDCNVEGTVRPYCDPNTGKCICRPGVTGILCDQCAPGHEATFPTCPPCHPCSTLWSKSVTAVKEKMDALWKYISVSRENPDYGPMLRKLLIMHSEVERILSQTGNTKSAVDDISKLQNQILYDHFSCINVFLYIMHAKSIAQLQCQPHINASNQCISDALEEIKRHHANFTANDYRIDNSTNILNSSKETRMKAKKLMSSIKCNTHDWDTMERNIRGLNICGAPGDGNCSEARCGGALCRDGEGKRVCGGPNCGGILPLSRKASDVANKTSETIADFFNKLKDADMKVCSQMTNEIKNQTGNIKVKINRHAKKFKSQNNETKDLIDKVKQFLNSDMVGPEDIERMANAVLAIRLPRSQDEIQEMIQGIQALLANMTGIEEQHRLLQDQVQAANELLREADEIKNRSEAINVSGVKKTIAHAQNLQDKVPQILEKAENNTLDTLDVMSETEGKLKNLEENLNTTRAKDLLDGIEALRNKTEMNRIQATEARQLADVALKNNMTDVNKLFVELMDKMANQNLSNIENDRLNKISAEVENIANDIALKMKEIEDLEGRIANSTRIIDSKEAEVAELHRAAEELRKSLVAYAEDSQLCKI